MTTPLTHFDDQGASRMVDVGEKKETARMAIASARIRMKSETLALILDKKLAKGDVLEVARLAGIMAAKKTDDLIPLCHSLPITSVSLDFEAILPDILAIKCKVKTVSRTGVEMEALTAVSIASLTVYDMAKAVDKGMTIECIRLESKSGGVSGDFARKPDE